MAKQKYKAQQVIDALKKSKGMIYLAAESIGCHPDTIYNYAKRYAGVQAEIDNQRGRLVDIAELKLHQAVIDGELGAVKYVLSTLGKGRGYSEGPTGKEDDPIHIKHTHELSDTDLERIAASGGGGTSKAQTGAA